MDERKRRAIVEWERKMEVEADAVRDRAWREEAAIYWPRLGRALFVFGLNVALIAAVAWGVGRIAGAW